MRDSTVWDNQPRIDLLGLENRSIITDPRNPGFQAVVEAYNPASSGSLPLVYRWRVEVRSRDYWQATDNWSWEYSRYVAEERATSALMAPWLMAG